MSAPASPLPPGSTAEAPPAPAALPEAVRVSAKAWADAYEALLLLLSHRRDSGQTLRLQHLAANAEAGATLPIVANWHGVAAVVHARLSELPNVRGALAPAVAETLRSGAHGMAAGSLMLVRDLSLLAARLDAEGVPFLVLKGPALADAYGGFAKRPFVDNDLLVRHDDYDRVERILDEEGYAHTLRTPRRRQMYLAVHGQYTFSRYQAGVLCTLDVHRAVVPFGLTYRLSFEDLIRSSRELRVMGQSVRALSPEDQIIALGYQGFKSFWTKLKHVADVAQVASREMDWDTLHARAEQSGSRRQVGLSLLLAYDLLGAPVPVEVVRKARADRRIRRLAREASRRLSEWGDAGSETLGARLLLSLGVQDGPAGWVRYTAYAVVRRLSESYVEQTLGHGRNVG